MQPPDFRPRHPRRRLFPERDHSRTRRLCGIAQVPAQQVAIEDSWHLFLRVRPFSFSYHEMIANGRSKDEKRSSKNHIVLELFRKALRVYEIFESRGHRAEESLPRLRPWRSVIDRMHINEHREITASTHRKWRNTASFFTNGALLNLHGA